MSDTERTQHMTDAEVLEDLWTQRKARRAPHAVPINYAIATLVLLVFALLFVIAAFAQPR